MRYNRVEMENQVKRNLDYVKQYIRANYPSCKEVDLRSINVENEFNFGGSDRYNFENIDIFVAVGFELMYEETISEFFSTGIVLEEKYLDLKIIFPLELGNKVTIGFNQKSIRNDLDLLTENRANIDYEKIEQVLLDRRIKK